jgi:cytochrome bd-type quinol oxidase subunit 2
MKREFLPAIVSASIIQKGLDDAASESDLPTFGQNIHTVLENIIQEAVLITGALAILAIVVAGIMLIASWGSENVKERAKKTIIYALIGLAVIFFAYVTVTFIVNLP